MPFVTIVKKDANNEIDFLYLFDNIRQDEMI